MVIPEPADCPLDDLPTRTQSELASTVRVGGLVLIRLDPALRVAFDGKLRARAGTNAHLRIASRAPVPPPPALDSLSLSLEQDARLYRGDAEWRNS